jgi:uncharacterized membrane protein YgcG
MSTDVRSFSRAIMADIPDAVQQYVEQVAKHVADAIRSLWHTASAHPFEFVIAVATAGIFIFAWVLARSTKRLWLAIKEASAIQSRDLQASIAVAQEAANAAAKSAAASARAVLDIQRALIVPTQFQSTAIVRKRSGHRLPNNCHFRKYRNHRRQTVHRHCQYRHVEGIVARGFQISRSDGGDRAKRFRGSATQNSFPGGYRYSGPARYHE